jgi:hypothetical protein
MAILDAPLVAVGLPVRRIKCVDAGPRMLPLRGKNAGQHLLLARLGRKWKRFWIAPQNRCIRADADQAGNWCRPVLDAK